MKVKYFVVVSLMLAILTIGAVSASEDVLSDDSLAVENEGNSIKEAPAEEPISSDADENAVGIVADDFKANITDKIDLANEDAQIAEVYYPEGASGQVSLGLTNVNDEEDSDYDYEYFSDYVVGDKIIFSTNSFTVSPGKYNAKLTYVDDDDNTIVLKESIIEFTKTITKDDFTISENSLIDNFDGDYIVNVWDYPTTGTLVVYVNGEKRYNKSVDDTEDDIYVYPNDLGITSEDKYTILVVFNTTDGQEIELDSFNVTVELYKGYRYGIDDESIGYGDNFNDYYMAYFSSYNSNVVGLLKFYVNNIEKFSHNIVSSDYQYDEEGDSRYHAYPNLVEMGITKEGTYDIRISFNGKDIANSKATLSIIPKVDYPDSMSVGEDQYLTVSYSGGSGTAELYQYDYEGDYSDKTPIAKFSITNGKGSYPLSQLPKGFHEYYLNYTIGGKNFHKTIEFSVGENTETIKASVTPTQITVGNTVSVSVTGPKISDMVDIYLDGTKVKSVSLVNGQINEVLSGLTVGTHVVRVFFESTDEYFFSQTYKVTVNSVPAKKADVIKLTLKKVKVKKSAKKLVLQATLKINGKAVKNKIIKFKFNKKTYKAKTNKKGIAKVTIKKSILKKLKVGKKIKYQASYAKLIKKVTVKVKK